MSDEAPKNIDIAAPATINVGHTADDSVAITTSAAPANGNLSAIKQFVWPAVVLIVVTLVSVTTMSIAAPQGIAVVLVTAVLAFITSAIGVAVAWLNRQETKALRVSVDGRLTQLLKKTGDAERAEALIEGKEQGKAEAKQIVVEIKAEVKKEMDEHKAEVKKEGGK